MTPRGVIAVVGAGIAGLAAARMLTERGFSVQVFERGRGVGGRTARRRAGVHVFDHGAQYFSVRDQRFASHVQTWLRAGVVAPWTGRIVALSRKDGSVRDTSSLDRYVGVPGMNAMAAYIAQDIAVRTRCKVTKISRRRGTWTLETGAGDRLGPYDAVVLAMPPEQAARLRTLPNAPVAARSLPCWCAMAAFAERLALDFDGAFVDGARIAWVARDSSKPSRPPGERWIIHASAAWSSDRIDEASGVVASQLLRDFFRACALAPVEPDYLAGHRWRFARPDGEAAGGCVWDATQRLCFCGDWCGSGRVEHAFLSGVAASEDVAAGLGHHTISE